MSETSTRHRFGLLPVLRHLLFSGLALTAIPALAQSTARNDASAADPSSAPQVLPDPQLTVSAEAKPTTEPDCNVYVRLRSGAQYAGRFAEEEDQGPLILQYGEGSVVEIDRAEIVERRALRSPEERLALTTRTVLLRDGRVYRGQLIFWLPQGSLQLRHTEVQSRSFTASEILKVYGAESEIRLANGMVLPLQAQVTLRDGTTWVGEFVYSRMGEGFTLRLLSGELRQAEWRDVQRLQRRPGVAANAQLPPAPPRSRRAGSEVGEDDDVRAQSDPGGQRMRVRVVPLDGKPVPVYIEGEFERDSDDSRVRDVREGMAPYTFFRPIGIASSILADVEHKRSHYWDVVCRAPCQMSVGSDRRLRIQAKGIASTDQFSLNEASDGYQRMMRIETRHRRDGLLAIGILLVVGGFLATIGGPIAMNKPEIGGTVLGLGVAAGISGGITIHFAAPRVAYRFE